MRALYYILASSIQLLLIIMADNVGCTCVVGSTDECEKCIIPHESPADARLSKRLSYILRYGAEKEGFRVTSEGEAT